MHNYHDVAVDVLLHLRPGQKVSVVFHAAVPQFRDDTLVQNDVPHVQQAELPQERLRFGETAAQAILLLPDDEGSVG